jgi:NADH-quinone oxidoreductase subunit J
MNLQQILFDVMGGIALVSALYIAASKNLVRSVFMLFVTLFALAGLYVLSLADFVAITQIVIYVGGILVLILFAFMLSGRHVLSQYKEQENGLLKISNWPALFLSALAFVVLANVIIKADTDHLGWIKAAVLSNNVIRPESNNLSNIGINLMSAYLLPFEVISVLLMMALIGAAHISRKEEQV